MKKLMIAALVAAMGGVVLANDCGMKCAYAYRIKLSGKTVTAKSIGEVQGECDFTECWAKPKSLRIAGYFYGATEGDDCEGCECIAADALVANSHFWNENKVQVIFDEVAMPVYDVLRNSGAKDKAQILITLGGLNLAGFGVYNPETKRLKRASGFFAGTMTTPTCSKYEDCEWTEGDGAAVFNPCDLSTEGIAAAESVIGFGRWAMAWKQDKVEKILKLGYEDGTIPSYLLPTGFTAKED